MSLPDIISNLFAEAQNSDPKEYTLGQGLRLRASWDGGLRRLLLVRPSVTPSEKEVEVCARDAGIKWFTTTPGSGKSGCWVLITELPSSPHREQWISEIVAAKISRDPFWSYNPDPWIAGLRKLSDAELEVEHIRNVRWHQPCKTCGRQPRPEPTQTRDPPANVDPAWDALPSIPPLPTENPTPTVKQSSLFTESEP